MTGSLGQKWGGLYCLAKENNQVGAWDMGTVPDALPGRVPLNDEQGRKHWELAWDSKLSPDSGLNMIRMIEEAERGTLKALYILGENPLRSLPQPDRVREALCGLEVLIVQDILETETTQLADVVLPGAAFSEKGGSFTNMEGRIQVFEPAVSPPGEAKPDWQILDLLASHMGSSRSYGSVEKVRREMSENIPSYAALVHGGDEIWVKETSRKRLFRPEGNGDAVLFSPFSSIEDEQPDESYPFTALFGSTRFHLGSGTRTGRSARINEFAIKKTVELSAEMSEQLRLEDGDRVRITSPHGSISREALVNKEMENGHLYISTGFGDNDARELLGLTPFGEPDSPGWNECRVRLEKQHTEER
jgi:predicted molibdopterin-dependent oxidoreductase YjgC